MAFTAITIDEMRAAYSLSEQGQVLVIETSGSAYHSVLDKDRKTVVLAAASNLAALKTASRVVDKKHF
jgi:hypothetical protein